MALVTPPKNCDVSVRKAIQQLDKKLGPTSVVTHTNITLTDLTASSLIGTNASKLLESVTIGTGLAYARPTLSLSHLGIEALTDAGADKIMFWDDTASACKWLVPNTLISITDTNLNVDNDLHNYSWTNVDATDLKVGSVTQAWDAGLDSLAGLTYAAAAFVKMTGANTFVLRTLQEISDDLEATIDHDNLLNFTADEHYLQSAITEVGTIGTGVWEGTSIAVAYTDAKCVAVWPDTYTADQNLLEASSPTFAALTVTTINGLGVKYTATGNIAVGDSTTLDALDADPVHNIAIGDGAGSGITDGDNNIFIGYRAGYTTTIAGSCIAIGYEALYGGTSRSSTVAIGYQAMRYHNGGNGNTIIGHQAGLGDAGGAAYTYNVFIGEGAGTFCNDGGSNVIVGRQAGHHINDGTNNIFIGQMAGHTQVDNSNLLIIDNQERVNVATELTNAILYGVMAAAPASQTLAINAATTVSQTLGVGVAAPTNGLLKVQDLTVDTTAAYYGLYNRHNKTAGITDANDDFFGLINYVNYNQSGGILGRVYGIYNSLSHTDGDIGTDISSQHCYAAYHNVDLAGGKVWGDARSLQLSVNQGAGNEITGDLKTVYLYTDSDGTVGGSVYMIYMEEKTGIDYGIYQDGIAQNVFGGTLKMKEAAAANADTATYGQTWVKNTAPCTPWFTDDAGNDGQFMLMRAATINADSDAADVQGCNVLWVDTSGGNITLGGLANGVDNQLLYVFKYIETNNLIIEHQEGTGTQKFMLDGADLTWAGVGICTPFICKNGVWYIAAYPREWTT